MKDAIQYKNKAYGKDGMLQLEYSNIGHLFVPIDFKDLESKTAAEGVEGNKYERELYYTVCNIRVLRQGHRLAFLLKSLKGVMRRAECSSR